MALALFLMAGDDNVSYLFLRNQFQWTLEDNTVFNATRIIVQIVGSIIGILGDLRYFPDFRIDNKLKITKQQVAKYHFEAFKINPAIGMAQSHLPNPVLFYKMFWLRRNHYTADINLALNRINHICS
uniref:Uncharacterized protein n=1 Tax=Glossina morsitans morsitans TaxID=37546 RepID=A0A1B0FQC5_GLOMM